MAFLYLDNVKGADVGGRGASSMTTAFTVGKSVIADSELKRFHARQMRELARDVYPDGTYDISSLTQVEYNSGFQVTFSQIGDSYTSMEYASLCHEFLDASSDGVISAGKFEGTPEISFNVSNKQQAVALAKKYNQKSVWDWENFDEIDTGGTGRWE